MSIHKISAPLHGIRGAGCKEWSCLARILAGLAVDRNPIADSVCQEAKRRSPRRCSFPGNGFHKRECSMGPKGAKAFHREEETMEPGNSASPPHDFRPTTLSASP